MCEPDLCVKIVMVYVYSGHDLDAAAEFMVSQGHGKSKNLEERRCLVELAYRRTSTPIIVGLLTDACLEQHSFQVLVCTCRYVVELRLWQWLCQQNCEKGVAPSRLQLIRIALSAIPTEAPLQVQQRLRQPLSSSARSQRRWLHRFRRAWGARLGTLQFYIQVKCVKHIRRPPFSGPFLVPLNGGHFLGRKPAFVWTGGGILPMDQCSFVCLQEAVPHCEHGRS